MAQEKPDHHDADLVLRVYDLRRDEVMRQSRHAVNREFWPRTYEDVLAVLKPDHPQNAAFRQVASYWEMVYSFARHGVVHPEFWIENNGEGMFLYAKAASFVDRLREDWLPVAFKNAEWAAKATVAGRRTFETFTARVRKKLESQ
jgi:hypothetical protein